MTRVSTAARNLLDRVTHHENQVLAFLDDRTIPFDNSEVERDLRSFTVQQKISGRFRSDPARWSTPASAASRHTA